MGDLILVLFLCLLISASAFFSASETALFSLSPLTLRSYRTSQDLKQKFIAMLMDRPRDVLVTILFLNVISNLLIQNTVSSIFERFPNWSLKVGLPLAITLIFGEVLPKTLAMPNNAKIAKIAAPLIHRLMRLFGPMRKIMNEGAGFISRALFFFLRDVEDVTVGELRHVVKTSLKKDVLSREEADLIEGALDLTEATVKELMRPREEVLFFEVDEPLNHLETLFVAKACTRFPVCQNHLDKIYGILTMKRYFLSQAMIKTKEDLLQILKKPFYVPESMKGWQLLHVLRERGESMAIVVDEYGSVSGLITQEDLVETVVGEISDKRDAKSLYTRSGNDVVIASGKLELSEFEDLFGIGLVSKENAVTLGGWLIEQLGDIPIAGTKYATDDFLFYVLAADPNRVRRVYVRKIRTPKKKGKR